MGSDLSPMDEIVQTERKPQLHQSGMSRLLTCGIDWEFRNVKGVREVPTFRLLEGTAVHKAAEMALRRKALGAKAELEEVIQYAREALDEAMTFDGARLTEDEIDGGIEQRKGSAIDYVTDIAKILHDEVVPQIEPLDVDHVEWKWVIELPDEPMDLCGTADVVTRWETIEDLKSKTSAPVGTAADTSEQLSWYAMAYQIHHGTLPRELALRHLVRTPAQRKTYQKRQVTKRTQDDIDVTKRRIAQAFRSIETGVFLPAPLDHWKCSRKHCFYHSQCLYAVGRVQG